MTLKVKFPMKYKIFFACVGVLICCIFIFSLIGYFTSREDDKNYVKYINQNLASMISNPQDTLNEDISKLVDFGTLFIELNLDYTLVNIFMPNHISHNDLIIKLAENEDIYKYKSPEPILNQIGSKFYNSEVYKGNISFVSTFGDVVSYRLLSTIKKIASQIKTYVKKTGSREKSYLVFTITDGIVSLMLYESRKGVKYYVKKLDYHVRTGNNLNIHQISKHLLLQMFLVED